MIIRNIEVYARNPGLEVSVKLLRKCRLEINDPEFDLSEEDVINKVLEDFDPDIRSILFIKDCGFEIVE